MAESPPHESADPGPSTAENAASTNGSEHSADLELPGARGLLKLRVPVRVTLASQRKSIHEITELGPGSIIKFDKTCDEPLELSVGDRLLAVGEVVKVGDKFGLRLSGLAH